VFTVLAKRLCEPLHALVGILDGLPIFIESDLLGRMIKLDRGEVPLVAAVQELLP
jgi:hypothetical protein